MADQNFELVSGEKSSVSAPLDIVSAKENAISLSQSSWTLMDSGNRAAISTSQMDKVDRDGVSRDNTSAAAAQTESRDWVNFGFLSHHQDRRAKFNERNFGLGWEHKFNEDISSSVGFYRNSIRKESAYAAVLWEPLHVGPIKAGVMAGVINGYPRLNHGNFIPMALPVASIEGRHLGANFVCIPKLKDVSAVCAVQIKARF